MEISIPIKGVRSQIKRDTLIVRSKDLLKALSSATLNGGLHEARAIIVQRILHMPETDTDANVRALLENNVESLGLPEPVIGLTTGVDLQNVAVVAEKKQDLTTCALVTAGISYSATAGDTMPYRSKGTGTINIVLLIDANLTEACMVDAVKTVTEAKSVALRELDIRSRFSSNIASGTITDGVVVAHTGQGELIKYAGTGTMLGELIGKAVRKAVNEAIQKQEDVISNRPLIKRLEERGISFEAILDTALELFVSCERIDARVASQLLKEGLIQVLSNVNVAALVMAGLRLQEDWEHRLIPGLPAETFEKEHESLVADKILGMAIANYIAGAEGIFEYTRFGKAKQAALMRLDPFSEDVIRGIIAGICARVRASL
jgi:alpha-ribazole phosphatase CobZ